MATKTKEQKENIMGFQAKPLSEIKGAKVEVKGKELIITLPMGLPQASASGSSMNVAGTRGARITDVKVNGHPVIISVNAYFTV